MNKGSDAIEWNTVLPTCDFCHQYPIEYFVDGATRYKRDAIMCEICYPRHGLKTPEINKYDAITLKKIED